MKPYSTLISPNELSQHLDHPQWLVVDCRFSLADPQLGRKQYLRAHIPGAVYAHLDEDLSAPVVPGQTGRHPLPSLETAARRFGELGIGPGVQVIAYDSAGGALAAVRVWWMLRWLGHMQAAVLDGGWQSWVEAGYPVKAGQEVRAAQTFIPEVQVGKVVTADEVDAMRQDDSYRVLDARTAERYRGENETIDPIAGHIPGAYSAPYLENLDPDGRFRPPEELRQHYQSLLEDVPPERAAFYCGSGVTSIHNILAMVHAGLDEPRLYAGSWSEWIADGSRPVATRSR